MANQKLVKHARAERMHDLADDLVRTIEMKIRAERVLQPPHMVEVFAVACAMSIAKWKKDDPALASDLAATALRVIIKNMMANGVTIPDLNMEGWTPPNIHWGTDTHH